jgi:hypothetical protein
LTASVIVRLLVFVFLLVKGSVEFFGHCYLRLMDLEGDTGLNP